MLDIATCIIPIPSSDGIVCSYGDVVLVNVSASNATVPANDLIFYDNTAASGTILGVVPKNSPNQTFLILNKSRKGIYVSNVSGWSGSIGLNS